MIIMRKLLYCLVTLFVTSGIVAEEFMKGQNVVSQLKLRASYGVSGNEFILQANYSDLGGAMQIMKPGYPLGSFNVYRWKGFDENGANLYLKKDGTLKTRYSPTRISGWKTLHSSNSRT